MGRDEVGNARERERNMHNGESRYHIMFVGDDSLPPDKDFAFLECGGDVWLAFKRSHITEAVLEEAWSAFRDMADCDLTVSA